jgi:hypothetical protein
VGFHRRNEALVLGNVQLLRADAKPGANAA